MKLSNLPVAEVSVDGEIIILREIFFECTSCTDCCKLNNIPVTEKDILKILDNGIEVDQIIEEMSPILIPSKNINEGFIKAYILRKKPFVNECVFLQQNSLCKIHPFKPLSCQMYPFSVRRKDEGFVVIIHPDCICNYIRMDVPKEDSNTLQIVESLLDFLSLD